MKRSMREVIQQYTQEEADNFVPSICPEHTTWILSSVVPRVEGAPHIRKYHISKEPNGSLLVYQAGYIYPYCGTPTMFGHVEVVFDEMPVPHESILKWSALALRAGPASDSARANQLVVVQGTHLHYIWRVLSVEAEVVLPTTRSLDITNLHLWREYEGGVTTEEGGLPCSTHSERWACGRVSLTHDGGQRMLTTSRGTRPVDWDTITSGIPEEEPIHKLYMVLLSEGLL